MMGGGGGVESVRLTVFVDDVLSEEGAEEGLLPAHGLGIHASVLMEDGTRVNLLIDGGPLEKVASHNMERLGLSYAGSSYAVLGLWSWHHVAAPLAALSRGLLTRAQVRMPSPPTGQPAADELPSASTLLVPLESPVYHERLVIFRGDGWAAAVVPCGVYGVDNFLRALAAFTEESGCRLKALVGGFNLSALDVYGIRRLVKFARGRGVELVVPLHTVALQARQRILLKTGGETSLPGAGTRLEVAV